MTGFGVLCHELRSIPYMVWECLSAELPSFTVQYTYHLQVMNDINVFDEAYYIEDQGGTNRNNHSKSQRFWIGYPAINQISFEKKKRKNSPGGVFGKKNWEMSRHRMQRVMSLNQYFFWYFQ